METRQTCTFRRIPAAALAGLFTLFLAGTTWAQEDQPPMQQQDTAEARMVSVVLMENEIQVEDTLTAGLVKFEITNNSETERSLALAESRFGADATEDKEAQTQEERDPLKEEQEEHQRQDPQEYAQQDGMKEHKLDWPVAPGETASLIVDLQPGEYVLYDPTSEEGPEGEFTKRITVVDEEQRATSLR